MMEKLRVDGIAPADLASHLASISAKKKKFNLSQKQKEEVKLNLMILL